MSEEKQGPVYRIHTQRLILRCWEPMDAPKLKEAVDENIEHLREWMPWAHSEPKSLDEKVAMIRKVRSRFDADEDYTYGVFSRDEKQVLGGTGLHTRVGRDAREIGYWIHAGHINQGLAGEAAAALCKVAFEIDGVQRVEIHCDPQNVRSAAVSKKLGFVHEETRRKCKPDPQDSDQLRDDMVWVLHREEYSLSPCAAISIEAFDALGRRVIG